MSLDLTLTVDASCRGGCSGCPLRVVPPLGGAAERKQQIRRALLDVQRGLGAHDAIDELQLIGGDLLAWPGLPPLLSLVGQHSVDRVFLYSPLLDPRRLPAVREAGIVRGFIVPFSPGSDHRRPANALDRAATLVAEGFEVIPWLLLDGDVDGFADAIFTRLQPRRVWVDAPGEYAVSAARSAHIAERAVRFGARPVFVQQHPPPCAGDLHLAAPTLFERVLARSDEAPNTTLPQCSDCDLQQRCRWRGDGDAKDLSPVRQLPERDVATWTEADDPFAARWYYVRDELPIACTNPWTNLEVNHLQPLEASVCMADWVRQPATKIANDDIPTAWNSDYYKTLRAGMKRGSIEHTCYAHCGVQAVRRQKKAMPRQVLTGRSEVFLRNRLRQFHEMSTGADELISKPTNISIGPSGACNHQCTMCHAAPARELTKGLELEEPFYDHLRTLLPTMEHLHVNGGGEPLFSHIFRRFLLETDWSKCPDLQIDLTTNGTALVPAFVTKLFAAPFKSFIVSVNAATRETFLAISGRDDFDKIIANIRWLSAHRHAFIHRRPALQLSYVVMRNNWHEIPDFLDFAVEVDGSPRPVAMEVDDRNVDLALWGDEGALAECLAMLDEQIHKHRDRGSFVQHLRGLRGSLQQQTEERNVLELHKGDFVPLASLTR